LMVGAIWSKSNWRNLVCIKSCYRSDFGLQSKQPKVLRKPKGSSFRMWRRIVWYNSCWLLEMGCRNFFCSEELEHQWYSARDSPINPVATATRQRDVSSSTAIQLQNSCSHTCSREQVRFED
jgi:hypothetical protein